MNGKSYELTEVEGEVVGLVCEEQGVLMAFRWGPSLDKTNDCEWPPASATMFSAFPWYWIAQRSQHY